MKMSRILAFGTGAVILATMLVAPKQGFADHSLTNAEIIGELTDRLLNVIYPRLVAQDASGMAATFFQDSDATTTVGDGYFFFEQPSGSTNIVAANIQGRPDIQTFLSGFFANVKPCNFQLHNDSLRFAINNDKKRPSASFYFTQTATVVFPAFGGDCSVPSTRYTWVMDITRSEARIDGTWYTLSDHNVLRSSNPPL